MKTPSALLATLETVLNRYLELDPESSARLKPIAGRVIKMELRGLDMALFLLSDEHGIQILGEYEGEVDTCLTGTPLALLAMNLRKDTEKSLFSGDVEITGDTELGSQFKQILDELNIDWEEHLSHYTGDIIAHQVGRFFRGARTWSEKAGETFALDVSDYLQEEKRLVVTQPEVEQFNAEIDQLRSDADRLEARIKRIQENLNDREAS